ncbi:hypothetical protein [Streptomyces hygroscopicus]|uniref:hypothetical protein n=1 Tax=Streptomyces hygroscopicus TaxID=1912 RepID=UPI0037AEDF90
MSPFELYPPSFDAALFWELLFVVRSGANHEFFGFGLLRRPLRGAAKTASTAVFAVGVTYAFAAGFGHLGADFTASWKGGLGYFAAALFVLFVFSAWVLAVIGWSDCRVADCMGRHLRQQAHEYEYRPCRQSGSACRRRLGPWPLAS